MRSATPIREAVTASVEPSVDAVPSPVEAAIDPIASPVQTPIHAVALPIEAGGETVLARPLGPGRHAIVAAVDPIALPIEPPVDVIPPTVEVALDPVAPAIPSVLQVARVSGPCRHSEAGSRQQSKDVSSHHRLSPMGRWFSTFEWIKPASFAWVAVGMDRGGLDRALITATAVMISDHGPLFRPGPGGGRDGDEWCGVDRPGPAACRVTCPMAPYLRSIVNIILKRLLARTAWGTLAGIKMS
jgi:hypothetical protein